MLKAKNIVYGRCLPEYHTIPPGTGIRVDERGAVIDVTIDRCDVEPTWLLSTGVSFGTGLHLFLRNIILVNSFTRNFYCENNVFIWMHFTFSRNWMRKGRSCSQLVQDDVCIIPMRIQNSMSYVGTSSTMCQVDFFHQDAREELFKVEIFFVNFDSKTRKSIPFPEEYKAKMFQSIVKDRHRSNIKPTVPAYPTHIPMSCRFEQEIEVDESHTDSYSHANNKMFVFLAFETLNKAIANKSRHHDIEVEDFDIIHEREAVEGDRLLCQILTADDETDADQMTYYAVIWNKRQATRLCYCFFKMTRFNDSKL